MTDNLSFVEMLLAVWVATSVFIVLLFYVGLLYLTLRYGQFRYFLLALVRLPASVATMMRHGSLEKWRVSISPTHEMVGSGLYHVSSNGSTRVEAVRKFLRDSEGETNSGRATHYIVRPTSVMDSFQGIAIIIEDEKIAYEYAALDFSDAFRTYRADADYYVICHKQTILRIVNNKPDLDIDFSHLIGVSFTTRENEAA